MGVSTRFPSSPVTANSARERLVSPWQSRALQAYSQDLCRRRSETLLERARFPSGLVPT
jgi:hypothetical protein